MKITPEYIIQKVQEAGEFVYGDDGFLYYEPKQQGRLSENDLRIIADELDKRNLPIQDELNYYFEAGRT